MTDCELRARLLEEIERDPEAELLRAGRVQILMYDAEYGREIRFRTSPHSRSSLSAMIHVGPNVRNRTRLRKRVVEKLLELDPRVLLTLRYVLIINSLDDVQALCERLDLDDETLPEAVLDEDENLNLEFLGVHWFYESAVIINLQAIRHAVEDVCASAPEMNADTESSIGFWTTLLHEIRHNQMDACPYDLPWIRDADADEAAVERWALDAYEKLF